MIQTRIAALREKMQQEKVQYVIIPTNDYHNSEYVSDYFKVREFFSGFTGSNGTLLVTEQEALLWTDGRYFIQAERELAGSDIILCRMGEEDVPTLYEYLAQHYRLGQVIGFDGRIITMSVADKIKEEMKKQRKECVFFDTFVPWEGIRMDASELPRSQVFLLPPKYSGEACEDKLTKLRSRLLKAGADGLWLGKLDDIMWLYNIRGRDVEYNPVALAYAYVDDSQSILMLQKEAVTKELTGYCKDAGIILRDYWESGSVCAQIKEKKILVDTQYVSIYHAGILSEKNELIQGMNPTTALKSVKNPVELENMREAYLKDSVALTKFLFWLDSLEDKSEWNEYEVAMQADKRREEADGFIELSFPTICAYGANAAMMHYEATQKKNSFLENHGLLLIDSGGQYYGGTTDVTRTIAMGEVTAEMKHHYTLVLKGMLRLSAAKFLYGCSGRNLDILARGPLWQEGIDYKCGTGHGVGYCLNVHEGPQSFRYKSVPGTEDAVLEAGMVITNEPGVYIEGSHGIRIENVLLCRQDVRNGDGQFMSFETLTKVSIDTRVIEWSEFTGYDRELLNQYHGMVYAEISPFLNGEEKEWLKRVTAPQKQ